MSNVIISTQMPDQFEKFKNFLNGKAVLMNIPMIEIESIEPNGQLMAVLNQIDKYNWLIFTSMRGIQCFFNLIEKFEINKALLAQLKFGCIGRATNMELNKFGFNSSVVNPGSTSKEFAKYLIDKVLKKDDNILLPLGKRADTNLPEALNNFCSATRIDVYQTIDIKYINPEILNIVKRGGYDLLVFTSPSAFENFINLTGFKAEEELLKIATIGNRTAESVEKQGFTVELIPKNATTEGLAKEIIEYLSHKQHI